MSEAIPTSSDDYQDALSQSDDAFGNSVGYEDRQAQEDEAIRSKFQAQLAQRGQRSPFSPDFLNSRPRSALERYHITAEEEEQVLYLYAATYSLHKASASAGISLEKTRAIVYSPSASQRIQEIRDEMKVSLLQKIEETQVVLLDELQNPAKLNDASITQISDVFVEISETQGNLISSLRESNSSIREIDPSVFDGEDLEYIALLRRRLSLGPLAGQPELDENPFAYEHQTAIPAEFELGESQNLDPSASGNFSDPSTEDDASGGDSLDLVAHDDPRSNGTVDVESL